MKKNQKIAVRKPHGSTISRDLKSEAHLNRTFVKSYRKFGSFPVSYPPRKIKLFKNCSHDLLHVRNVVKDCSLIHADTF